MSWNRTSKRYATCRFGCRSCGAGQKWKCLEYLGQGKTSLVEWIRIDKRKITRAKKKFHSTYICNNHLTLPVATMTLESKHHRLRSLSLIASRSPLLNLPPELILDILELSLTKAKPSALAAVSKMVSTFVESIIYRTVVLDSARAVSLFHRTIEARSSLFLASHVKKLVVSWSPTAPNAFTRLLWDIVTACTGARSLTIPTGFHPVSLSSSHHDTLSELTIESYDELGGCASLSRQPSPSLTHLRICEPSMQWYSPASMLESFGPLLYLTHLQFARRIHANDENDLIFMEDICNLLRRQANMKMIVVSIFAPSWAPSEPVEDSNIWKMMHSVAVGEPRLIVVKGEYGQWKNLRDIDFWRVSESLRACSDK